MEFELVVSLAYLLYDPVEPVQGKPVESRHTIHRHSALLGIEIGKVAQEESAGVSDTAISLGKSLENFTGDPDVVTVIFR